MEPSPRLSEGSRSSALLREATEEVRRLDGQPTCWTNKCFSSDRTPSAFELFTLYYVLHKIVGPDLDVMWCKECKEIYLETRERKSLWSIEHDEEIFCLCVTIFLICAFLFNVSWVIGWVFYDTPDY